MFRQTVRSAAVAGLLLVLVGLTGCGPRFNITKNYTDLDPTQFQGNEVPAFPSDTTIAVEFTSTKADVTVAVFKQSDVPVLENANASKAMEKKTGKEGSFTVAIPKGTPINIVVMEAKGKTDVTLKAKKQ